MKKLLLIVMSVVFASSCAYAGLCKGRDHMHEYIMSDNRNSTVLVVIGKSTTKNYKLLCDVNQENVKCSSNASPYYVTGTLGAGYGELYTKDDELVTLLSCQTFRS